MAYQVLARKWRPKTLTSIQGQTHVTQALANALKKGWLHHAYLFCGTRGVGKTSLARIFAKCLNCETGVTDNPCGTCRACHDIDAGRFVDLIEVDAASRTKVEDTRELLENVAYQPTQGRFKVYIIDEVHMLSGHSFNALLKTLEEPPEHIKFIFATTEPDRLPITVLSRVLRFDLKPLSLKNIIEQLALILQSEGVQYSDQSLHYIAENAQGSMRDALSLLERVIAFSDGDLQSEKVAVLLGLAYQAQLSKLLEHLVQRDFAACVDWIDTVAQASVDYTRILDSLLSSLYILSVQHKDTQIAKLHAQMFGVPLAVCEADLKISPSELQLLYQIAILAKKDMVWAPDPKLGLQMALLRMMDFTPNVEGAIEVKSNAQVLTPTVSSVTTLKEATVNEAAPPASKVLQEAPVAPILASSEQPTHSSGNVTLDKARQRWSVLVESLNLSGFASMLARHCTIKAWQQTHLVLALNPQHQAYLSAERQKQLEEAIFQKTGKKLKLRFEIGAVDALTPNQEAAQKHSEAQAALRAKVESDSVVQAFTEAFDASIGDIQELDK